MLFRYPNKPKPRRLLPATRRQGLLTVVPGIDATGFGIRNGGRSGEPVAHGGAGLARDMMSRVLLTPQRFQFDAVATF